MNPVLVEVLRGNTVESVHRGAVVAVNAEGKTVLALGDTDALVFPRSALKPLQVLPLLESGAAEHFALHDQELSLACASHSGEEMHLQVLERWMKRIGIMASQLECGPSLPLHKETAEQHLRRGGVESRELHNCSGKHAGMLTFAAFLGESLKGYSEYHHPTQQKWMSVLSELSGVNIFDMPWDRDGCGLPAVAMPLSAFAKSFTPFIASHHSTDKRSIAMAKVTNVMRTYPQMVAGTDRCCTAAMQSTDSLMVKVGAEGVFVAVALDSGLVVSLKTDDGANRAAEVMLGAALRHLGVLNSQQYESLAAWFSPSIKNSQHVVVGSMRAAKAWRNIY